VTHCIEVECFMLIFSAQQWLAQVVCVCYSIHYYIANHMPANHLLINFTQFTSSKKSMHWASFNICTTKNWSMHGIAQFYQLCHRQFALIMDSFNSIFIQM